MAFHAITANVQGGSALERHLREIENRLGRGAHVNVGFLESATYPAEQRRASKQDYTFGGKNKRRRYQRNLNAKNSQGQPLHVAQVAFWNEYGTVRTPSRPFFRTMIESKSPRWGVSLGNILRKNNYNAERALALMGEGILGQLRDSILNWPWKPNAPRTIEQKGFDKPLVDSAVMLRAGDYQVLNGPEGDDAT